MTHFKRDDLTLNELLAEQGPALTQGTLTLSAGFEIGYLGTLPRIMELAAEQLQVEGLDRHDPRIVEVDGSRFAVYASGTYHPVAGS